MTPEDLAGHVLQAARNAVAAGAVSLDVSALPTDIKVERPKQREHGDWATSVALQLAKPAGVAPRVVADAIAVELRKVSGVSSVDVAGPGFINITLDAGAAGELARAIVTAGSHYGRAEKPSGETINVEFISANPTGPLHLGHTRWAAVGDALARVLEAAGAKVAREFYINDRGVQMDKFGTSVMEVANGRPVPEDGYHGAYIGDLAREIVAVHPEYLSLPADEQMIAFREAAYALQLQQQKDVLKTFNTVFDVWYSERTLHESGAVERGFAQLRAHGHMFDQDGAVWLRTTDFDDDKDRVLVKSDGDLTYFASDTAYYVDKRNRGFDRCIYLLGADHHGYVNRLRAISACAGDDPDVNIELLIGQMVKMMKGGEEVRLSKRAGNIITLEDLVEEVGVDAARYSLIRYPVDTPLVLDLDLLIKKTNENPVFYVQYAHARISSMLRQAGDLGIDFANAEFDPSQLTHEKESVLLSALGEFPRIVAGAAQLREPHRIARYLEDLATDYHRFYDQCRVLPQGDEAVTPLVIARLWLCNATRQVLANGLDLCGVSAPERM
jgi:arginyl-tRNA synthetase